MRFLKLNVILIGLILSSCSQMEKATDLITGLSEKEQYQKKQNIPDKIFELWESRIQRGLKDSLEIELPYLETGSLKPRDFAIYSYQTYLIPGEILETEIITDTTATIAFIELYRRNSEAENGFEQMKISDKDSKSLKFETERSGLYKIIIQPEIEANTSFTINIQKIPTYLFPVINGKNSDIGSYYGDMREGGIRDHKGVDIFAKRGTPVIAATSGRIGFTGEKGLGGKQVWLRDPKRKQSLYYAHLDSIVPDLKRVQPGDTLGFVGNTGNAKTTPSHLHFGIYKQGAGAIDPIGFVYKTEEMPAVETLKTIPSLVIVSSNKANFRNKPASNNSRIIKKAGDGELLSVQGKTKDWFHVRDSLDRSLYIHESLVTPKN